MQDSFIYIQC